MFFSYEIKLEMSGIIIYFDPIGITNDQSSAHCPHSILYAWNIEIHVAIATNQIIEPIADIITSILCREESKL
jgi:hypothetical protein